MAKVCTDTLRGTLLASEPQELQHKQKRFERGLCRGAAPQKGQGGLSGRLPSFAPAVKLASLRLHSNSFTGPLPELPGSIQEVRLAGNQLTGGVPSAYSRLAELHTLKADSNCLSGRIERSAQISMPELPSLRHLPHANKHLKHPFIANTTSMQRNHLLAVHPLGPMQTSAWYGQAAS